MPKPTTTKQQSTSAKKVSFDMAEYDSIAVELEAVLIQTQLLMQFVHHHEVDDMVTVITVGDIFGRLWKIDERFDAAGKTEVSHA